MTEKTWQRNTSGLAVHAKRRAEHKQQQVDQAIGKLLRENKPINFNAVATAAGVTKRICIIILSFATVSRRYEYLR